MQSDEKIQAHLVSVWRESKKFFSIGGKEGMLLLTDKHLMFVHKTESMMKWWKAIIQRQVINFLKSKNTMIRHDGYDEEELMNDLKHEKFQYAIAQDWVKYPAKEPTKYMKVDWEPWVQYIKDRQIFTK